MYCRLLISLSMDKAGNRMAGTNAIGPKYQSLSILTLRFRSGFTMIRDTHKIYFFSFYLDKLKHVRQVKACYTHK